MYLDDHHYLPFYVPGIGQIQLTCIPQRTKTFIFIFNELMNIILEPIPAPQSESSVHHGKSIQDPASLAFYIDDIFEAFKTYH